MLAVFDNLQAGQIADAKVRTGCLPHVASNMSRIEEDDMLLTLCNQKMLEGWDGSLGRQLRHRGQHQTISTTMTEARMNSAVKTKAHSAAASSRTTWRPSGGGNGAVAAPGQDRFDQSLHHLLLRII
jgi:hypothetical protein